MTKTFVAINDPVHSLIRSVTRHILLRPGLSPDQRLLLQYGFRERRADTMFLDQVTQTLQRMRGRAEIAAFLHPPLNLAAVMKMHLRCQSLWKSPPATARVLLRRLEYLLANTIVDDSPATVYLRYELAPKAASRSWTGNKPGLDCRSVRL
jgi:hypothetical protein